MIKKMSFDELLSFFPEIELPVTFNDEVVQLCSRENKPLPGAAYEILDMEWQETIDNDTTEIIPCLRLPKQDEFQGLVYWKGDVLKSEFILVTVDLKGKFITKKSIASTSFENEVLKKSIAMIDEDLIIHIMAGANVGEEQYDSSASQSFSMEIMTTGDILFALND